jgi:hypothetical protein
MISEGESLQTYALQRAATGTGTVNSTVLQLLTGDCNNRTAMCLLRNGGKGEYMSTVTREAHGTSCKRLCASECGKCN